MNSLHVVVAPGVVLVPGAVVGPETGYTNVK